MLSFNVMSIKPIEEAVTAAAVRIKEICESDYTDEVVLTACRELVALINAITKKGSATTMSVSQQTPKRYDAAFINAAIERARNEHL